MAIKYRGNIAGSFPQFLLVPPGAAFNRDCLLKMTSGKVVKCTSEAANQGTRPLFVAEEAATADVTPPVVRAIPLSPDALLDVEVGAIPVNGVLIDVTADGDYGTAADAAGAGGVTNGKLRVLCRNPDESFTTVTTSGALSCTSATPMVATLAAHGFATGDMVFFNGGTPPTGFTAGVPYFVIRVDANTFRLASSKANAVAGTALASTGTGTTPTVGSYAGRVCPKVIAVAVPGGTLAS